jgi:hypothetical protein
LQNSIGSTGVRIDAVPGCCTSLLPLEIEGFAQNAIVIFALHKCGGFYGNVTENHPFALY